MSQWEEIKARVAGHTPGPWGVHADTHEYRGGGFMQVEPVVGTRTICDITDQNEANAALIAAAPNLLAALEAALGLAKTWHEEYEVNGSAVSDSFNAAAYNLEAAISKALE